MRVSMRKTGVATMVAAILAVGARADSGRGRHKQLYVVPAPGPVAVDGQLGDWDLSGQIEMFVVEATRATMSAKFAAMYDAEALYLSGEIRDPTPLRNRHDPQINANRAWDADAVQFRLAVDPAAGYPLQGESSFKYRAKDAPPDTRDDIVHLLLWHYTDDGSANLQMHCGMSYRVPRPEWSPHGLVPQDAFQGAYRTWEAGDGYSFEYRIPWPTLGAKLPPQGGDTVAGSVQVNWSRPDGLATGGGGAWSYDILGEPGFPFQNAACWGRLIFVGTGNIPRERVLEGVPPERGLPLEFVYELPEDSPHTTLQLFTEDNQAVRVLLAQADRPGGVNRERWDGLDDRGRVLPAGTYRWRGVRGSTPLRAEYRFSVHNAGQPPHPTTDNRGGWGSDHGPPQSVAALDDGLLLGWSLAEYGWGIIRTDRNGRKLWGTKRFAYHLATDGKRVFVGGGGGEGMKRTPGVGLLDVKDARPVRYADGTSVLLLPGGEPEENHVTGLAYGGGRVYAAFARRDAVGVFNAETGVLMATVPVAAPQRLVITPEGDLLVVSEAKVWKVRGLGTEIREDSAPGVFLATHLDDPQGLAVGRDGAIYVANRGALQDVSVFDQGGQYLRSIGKPGGRSAAGRYDAAGLYQPAGIALDATGRLWVAEAEDFPKRFSVWEPKTGNNVLEFFGSSSYFAYGFIDPARPDEIYAHNVIWRIDWKSGRATPITTIWRQTDHDMAPHPNVDAHSSGGGFRLFTTGDGRQFGFCGAGNARGLMLYQRGGDDIFHPVAGVIDPWSDTYPALEPCKANADAKATKKLFWQDTNRDGRVSMDEVVPLRDMDRQPSALWVDPALTVHFGSGHVLSVSGTGADGRPVYDLGKLEEGPLVRQPLARGWLAMDVEGRFYTLNHRDGPSLIGWSPEGHMLWNYPDLIRWQQALNLPVLMPGRLWSMTRSMGVAGEYFAHQTYTGMNHVFRRDGLYIGGLLQDGRVGGKDEDTGQPEGQGGAFVKLALEGKERYFAIGGGQDVRVWEVLGLDTLEDLPGGEYVHSPEQEALARQTLADYESRKAERPSVRIVPGGREALADAPEAKREVDGKRGFTVRLAYDAETLYVRFEVKAEHPLTNRQSEPNIVFRGGNLLDLQIATAPEAEPKRTRPAPGDKRLLVTRQDGKPFAVLYEPKVAGFEGRPEVLTSPTGEEPFDRIRVLDTVALDFNKTSAGFSVTVGVPLADLGWKPQPGTPVRMDAGYVFGNKEGTRTMARAYLFNASFSANVVDDIPHESRLEPGEWGEATVQ